MPYLFDDEDNVPMNEDAWNEEWERKIEAREIARDMKRSAIWEGFMDDMEIPRGSACRECPWMKEAILETYEDMADEDGILPGDVYDLAHRMCAVCNAHKDDSDDERYDAINAFFREEDEKNGNS